MQMAPSGQTTVGLTDRVLHYTHSPTLVVLVVLKYMGQGKYCKTLKVESFGFKRGSREGDPFLLIHYLTLFI